ncbi:MAG TPA: LysM peptidoglycan-binding domain-containing protein, partial [Rhodospirillaceae bacterium]|nr:LysM peptidoglycan-binding domain-containing protein [Rhodospirillaceae bacterium]
MTRPHLIALVVLLAAAAAAGLFVWSRQHALETVQPVVAEHPAGVAVEAPPAPSFDVVRVNPQGEAVIAGRAMPRAEVVILDGTQEFGRVIADNRGEWVFIPDHPLPPGSRELSLRASNPDGSTTTSESPVLLVVPERAAAADGSLAVRISPDGTIEILQGPDGKGADGPLSIAGVRYDSRDRLSVTGKAEPKARLRIYLDNQPLGHTTADARGGWQIAPKIALHAGTHAVRADQLGAAGKVTARVEISFSLGGTLPAEGKLVVEKGNSLWKIARRAYGSGFEYLSIYRANKEQIRDPDRIYPGQVFAIP